ncbi:flagellar hook-associated protein FlgK [Oceanicola sp. 502str15]|uniref:flagellar hook-associated protein FlgK n=1 Tax=Oceanicola sp. 502str15 TaxID=2696061 RepID=UPI002094338B|nr:flagellar hook-associated protein FlgK [Oceanicola sp. 502str15]MCO6384790.1 flagellar hook-associated protein FlgK [Oceanicola sp. 502str15]
MTYSAAMSAALSGLNASKRQLDVISSNIANANTEGYGRRSLTLNVRELGGVSIGPVQRASDIRLIGDRRLSDAAQSEAGHLASTLTAIEDLIGEPGDPASLTTAYSNFEGALIEAASRPDLSSRLDAVGRAGSALAEKFNTLSDGVQEIRMEADQSIAREVHRLNAALEQVVELNARIFNFGATGQNIAALMDQRQSVIDSIAELVPIRQVDRDGGRIALYTPTSAILVDGTAAEIGFDPVGLITSDMTLASGALSGLTINGNPISTSGDNAPMAGGKMHALFAARDEIAPKAQAGLDLLARDLVDRFQDPTLDTTLGVGAPGLFTDGGAAFLPTEEEGLAKRLEFNILVDPDEVGESWRIRDGLGAAAPGVVGNSTLVQAISARFSASIASASAASTGTPRSAGGHAADLLTSLASERASREVEFGFHIARFDTIKSAELAGGVDTDHELQKLLVVEQAYAANAKVIQTIDELIDRLMAI